jgi:1-acyl-sn-glycerol-3-phosphate acyltransferase
MRDRHEAGRLAGPAGRSVWLQVLRLALAGMGPGLRSHWRRLRAVGFAARAWVGLAVVVLPAYPILLALPGLARRWQVMRVALRIGFVLAGIPVRVENAPALAASGPSVLVSNHASYLDSLVLASVLPRPVAFVAKRELAGIPALRVLLERLGTQLVERFDRERSAADARELSRRASRGDRLAYFPEGTLHRMPGLLPFQLGAFIAAAEADVPVRPVVLRGTRSILRGESRFPRPGMVHVEVLAERHPAEFRRSGASGWDVALALRNAVREDMLAVCGEPDLAHRRALQELSESRGHEEGG